MRCPVVPSNSVLLQVNCFSPACIPTSINYSVSGSPGHGNPEVRVRAGRGTQADKVIGALSQHHGRGGSALWRAPGGGSFPTPGLPLFLPHTHQPAFGPPSCHWNSVVVKETSFSFISPRLSSLRTKSIMGLDSVPCPTTYWAHYRRLSYLIALCPFLHL